MSFQIKLHYVDTSSLFQSKEVLSLVEREEEDNFCTGKTRVHHVDVVSNRTFS